jgi:hypothetical protein
MRVTNCVTVEKKLKNLIKIIDMKLAEALSIRADLQKRIDQLEDR